ncbi:ABC-type dipeptide/oligopeptide/nickel transport system, permease component [Cenarchaeum symbiosum A]|uniref:ABC-type dipeptide/oligopeptide/nickel transport system, permease component n=1 Tax=Cenarchaeum symbiosum (strain A) TaxID=414004 RepID=A0RX63_CENSY|nr:ABC-type dipeptide/oligopeptide/nickel transport system, permease component [Cenarchaeum symbiosum A]
MGILAILVAVSISAVILVPVEVFHEWNNPGSWISLPKASVPVWVNWLQSERIPEHMILDRPEVSMHKGGVSSEGHGYTVGFDYGDFPSGFIYEYTAEYTGSPLLRITVVRPDGLELELLSESLPPAPGGAAHSGRVFSTDPSIRKALEFQSDAFAFSVEGLPPEDVIFSKASAHEVLPGEYSFLAGIYGTDDVALDSRLIIGGKAFGMMGTDELRRDLAVGLVWGTPLALFIGLAVAVGSVVMGLVYGVYAGYRGGATDEGMMRLNDIVYALPALPFLIILAVTISSSIFVIIGFLMIFGWVGIARVSRSMALQIKTRGYVQASRMMGQGGTRVIFKHIIPQLLPYAFASIAISVPAAITTEAGLSFLGLGDPSFPTWGQMLHDANAHGAVSRGLWWWVVPPGLMIAATGLAFVFIGNAMDAIVNPRLRRR